MAAERRSRPAAGAGRRFAWYGRLSTKDKQDPTISFPSQREACATKAEELGGEIVCEFTDQEAGRRDDRAGWAELLREAKERDARRFDAVIVYGTSRLSRDLFHALTYEREMTRTGVEVFYALTAGDQTSPEGRLIRHMFQALDQFEVEKLGREVRRGQKQNTRQGYRNGGRAPYGYRLRHEAHPDPARAKAGDTKSRLVVDPEQAPVIAEIFDRFLAGAGYKEIANELNRPGGPPPPSHVDSKRNTSGKWAKTTIKSMLENPTYTGRLYWNRLDSRAHKQGVGPVVRREQDEWVEADERHEALISEEQFERAQAEMQRRSTGQSGNRRRRPQKRPYLLRGIVHCATGHNPLRMQGRSRKGEPTYYTCGYRTSYGDRAAEAVGHGKWQYVREDSLTTLIDSFFATRIFGDDRLAHFRRQGESLSGGLRNRDGDKCKRIAGQIAAVEQKIERQLAAIEVGVDPVEVGRRIRELKAERAEAQSVLAQIDDSQRDNTAVDPEDARAILDALPDLGERLAAADPDVRRAVFDAFRLHVEIDRNASQIRLKALVSSAFGEATNLSDLGEAGDPALSDKAIPLRRYNFAPMGRGSIALIAALLVAASLLAGCGGSSDDSSTTSISKEEFIKKADVVCKKGTERMQRAVLKFLKHGRELKSPTDSQSVKLVGAVIVPSVQQEIKELKALGVPSGDEEKVDAIVGALEEGVETAESDPQAVVKGSSEVVFGIASRIAGEYGIKACGVR